VEVKSDPVPVSPDSAELEKRNKLREGWKKTRKERKLAKAVLQENNTVFDN
jgi:hypothetical protein